MYGEIGHMHGSDGSMHLNLAPRDVNLVLEKGWGQRHPLSGTVLYLGDFMVYSPRNEEELEVVMRITGQLLSIRLEKSLDTGSSNLGRRVYYVV